VRALKAEEGKGIYLCGGGRLAASLAPEIDELVVKRSPITIGAGIPMFASPVPLQQWRLTDSHTIDIGVTFGTYRRAG